MNTNLWQILTDRAGWKSNNRENYPISGKFFCMTQKPSAVCKKSYSQCKTLLSKLNFVIPFFKNNSTWKLWAKFINKDYPTGWVWQTLANTYNKLTILSKPWIFHVLGYLQAFSKPKIYQNKLKLKYFLRHVAGTLRTLTW